jgi:hypothetical protein
MRVLLLVLALTGCHTDVPPPMRHVGLPGFSLDVPVMLADQKVPTTYPHGELRDNGRDAVYSVVWNPRPLPDDVHIPQFSEMLAKLPEVSTVAPAAHLRVGELAALRFDVTMGSSSDFFSLVAIGCGQRTVQIMVRAHRFGEQTLQAMLAHFDCRPNGAEDDRIAHSVPVGLDDRAKVAGWKHVPDPGSFTLSDPSQTHAVSFTTTDTEATGALAIFAQMAPAGWKLGPPTTSDGRQWAELTTPAGKGLAISWPCGPQTVIGFAVGFDAAAAHELLLAFRCPKPDDPPLP